MLGLFWLHIRSLLNQSVTRHVFSLASCQVCAQLEAVLSGHEDRVHSVRWRKEVDAAGLTSDERLLLSASMDKTMQVCC